MIEEKILKDYSQKSQTSFQNILREYVQHLFLASFYKKTGAANFLFKGGTALKLVFGSPRFSEDLDFSGLKNSYRYEEILAEVLLDLSFEKANFDLIESKPTTGGHLAILKTKIFGESFELHQEISFRPEKSLVKEIAVVTPDFFPSYQIYILAKEKMIGEKIKALLTRQKPRDFFDLYFILRKNELRQRMKLKADERESILTFLEKQDKAKISRELRMLLPKSFWPIIKDLPRALKTELERR